MKKFIDFSYQNSSFLIWRDCWHSQAQLIINIYLLISIKNNYVCLLTLEFLLIKDISNGQSIKLLETA